MHDHVDEIELRQWHSMLMPIRHYNSIFAPSAYLKFSYSR